MRVARVKNITDERYIDKYDGQVYIIEPGEEVNLPEHVAKLFIGDWNLTDINLRAREKRRVEMRGSANKLILLKVIDIKDKRENKKPEPETSKPIFEQDIEPEFEEFKKKKRGKVV